VPEPAKRRGHHEEEVLLRLDRDRRELLAALSTVSAGTTPLALMSRRNCADVILPPERSFSAFRSTVARSSSKSQYSVS
tara:strand:- start:3928 stop:4164 length:237 start_codon:yes stop_codon:yes gene_type:complete